MKRMRTLTFWLLLMIPTISWAQSQDTSSTQAYSPLEVDFSVMGHSLFGKGIGELPGKTNIGYAAEATLKYRLGNFGLAVSGGFWSTQYEPSKPGINYTQRLDNISAHYLLAGPYFHTGNDKIALEINPRVGVQRFYFPHLVGTSTINGNAGTLVERVRTDFDAGASVGLGLKAKMPINEKLAIHARFDYLTTIGSESFKYIYSQSSRTFTNTNPLQSISIGGGVSMALTNVKQPKQKSLAPTALDVGLGAGLNFLTGKGIDNLPGNKSVGYDASTNLNYRIGRSGLAVKFGFWDNKYDRAGYQTRLDNLSAHYLSFGPIVPVSPKKSKLTVEAVPHIGIQRIYFPHSQRGTAPSANAFTRTNLEAGWSAGLTAKVGFPVSPVIDFIVSADYTSMLTDRGFGFSVGGSNGYANRKPLQRFNIGAGVAYNLMKKVEEVEMSPDEIQKLIEEKEDDTEKEAAEDMDMQVGDDEDMEDKDAEDSVIETIPADPRVDQPVVTEPAPSTTEPVTTEPVITTPSTTVPPSTTTTPSTTSPVYTTPSTTTTTTPYTPPTVYRVQFVALSKDVKVFNELKQYGTVILEYYSSKGLYRYMVGDASSEEEGMQLLNTIHNNGWPKAFLVKYQDGVRTRVR